MSNPEFHTCTDCGYKWRHGQHGGHNCQLRIKEQRDELLKALKGVQMMAVCGQLDAFIKEPWLRAVNAAIQKAEGKA